MHSCPVIKLIPRSTHWGFARGKPAGRIRWWKSNATKRCSKATPVLPAPPPLQGDIRTRGDWPRESPLGSCPPSGTSDRPPFFFGMRSGEVRREAPTL